MGYNSSPVLEYLRTPYFLKNNIARFVFYSYTFREHILIIFIEGRHFLNLSANSKNILLIESNSLQQLACFGNLGKFEDSTDLVNLNKCTRILC